MIITLKKKTRKGITYCVVNSILLEKRLYTANNPNPDVEDLRLCVENRGMPKEVLKNAAEILAFFNSEVQDGRININCPECRDLTWLVN